MVRSMTGFGRAEQDFDGLNVTVEIKSVNHRYFEFSSRLPRSYQYLEEKLKNFCQGRIARGKVEVSVLIDDTRPGGTKVEINGEYCDSYLNALKTLKTCYDLKDDISVMTVARNPEVFKVTKSDLDADLLTESVLSVASAAADAFVAMRETEGQRLKADVENRVGIILNRVELIEKRSPETVKIYREKIEQKMLELLGNVQVDEQRLLTETAIFADKVAVAEETVRLRSHMQQLCALMEDNEAIGRKLDFVVQEMNREANTIGSKAQDIEIARAVIDIKAEIEKIREQIQNIE
ncbi:MAG: YicC family protein [Ruminococcaceae bacterium]|nr:YicC family protein [Oscillospiraceae bacterium]